MSEVRGEIELYNQWFLLADADRDGQLSGAEAVQFFERSGLPQHPTLFKVWQHVAGDRPALNRQQFYTAMKLVSLAQSNGGVLDPQQAARLVNGLAGHVPPPYMEGLVLPADRAAAPPARPVPAPPPPPPAVAAVHAVAAAPAYPPLSSDQATAYQLAFAQLDTDHDGYAQGVDCFPVFMQSGLHQAALKQVWDVVAGDDGQLSAHQFVQCLYLIECAKHGIPIPGTLPPGQFPPVAGGGSLQHAMGAAQQGLYSAGPLHVPPMPPRASYLPAPPAHPAPFASQVPPPPAGAAVVGMVAAERARLDAERQAALLQEALQRQAEEERRGAAARAEFFTASLAALRLAQSKVARAVVEAQQRLEMGRAEAEVMEGQYNAAYEAFSAEHVRAGPLLEAVQAVEREKAGLAGQLEALRASVAQLEAFDPEWEGRERAECEAMRQEIAALTVRQEALQLGAQGAESRRDALRGAIQRLAVAGEGAEGEVAALQAEVAALDPAASDAGAAVVGLLRRLAPLYNALHAAAKAALVPLPAEALASIARAPAPAFKYAALHHAAAAAGWEPFQDDGFRIVSALPGDARLEQFTSPSLAAAEGDEAAGGGGGDPPAEQEEAEEAEEVAPLGVEVEGGGPEGADSAGAQGGDAAAQVEPTGGAAPAPEAEAPPAEGAAALAAAGLAGPSGAEGAAGPAAGEDAGGDAGAELAVRFDAAELEAAAAGPAAAADVFVAGFEGERGPAVGHSSEARALPAEAANTVAAQAPAPDELAGAPVAGWTAF